jgi:hypothetical protein
MNINSPEYRAQVAYAEAFAAGMQAAFESIRLLRPDVIVEIVGDEIIVAPSPR